MEEEKRKLGRPAILTPVVRKEICDAIRRGVPLTYACDLVGITRQAVYMAMKSDRDFFTQINMAKAIAVKGLVALTVEQNGAWKILKNIARDEFQEHVEIEVGPSKKLLVRMGGDGEDIELER